MWNLLRMRGFGVFLILVLVDVAVDVANKVVLHEVLRASSGGATRLALSVLVDALLVLPFVLLVSPGGMLADRYSRVRMLRASAWLALIGTLALAWSYRHGVPGGVFALTGLLAVQNALFAPLQVRLDS